MLQLRSLVLILIAAALNAGEGATAADDIRLKDYRPASIYRIPRTEVPRARFPATDFHAHDFAKTPEAVDAWVKAMDAANVARSIILSFATSADLEPILARYGKYPDRFEVWCFFDFTRTGEPGWSERAVADLERCHRMGARGVGELMDKGMGFKPVLPTATLATALGTEAPGMHLDDPRLRPLFAKCAELRMPINVHVAEDAWMYLPADKSNDGLMNGANWKVDMTRPGILDHDQLVATLDHAARDNPRTTFIACHLANCCSDLTQLGRLLDAHPNLFADIGGRFGEIAPIPRAAKAFFMRYHERLLYGTDAPYTSRFYQLSFRILESADEHFYDIDMFGYHWPLHGLALEERELKALYQGNGERLLARE
jgi:predicted TIM-barrel fold metal-dependent hydrolase